MYFATCVSVCHTSVYVCVKAGQGRRPLCSCCQWLGRNSHRGEFLHSNHHHACSFLSQISLHVAHVLYRTSLCSLVFACSPISLNPSLDWPPIHCTHCNQLNINAIPTSGIWCLQILMQFLQVFGGISRSSLYQASVAKALRSIS